MLSYCIILRQTLKNKTFSPKYEFFYEIDKSKKTVFFRMEKSLVKAYKSKTL